VSGDPVIRCIAPGCTQPAKYPGKRMCNRHYLRMWKYGSFELPKPPTREELFSCRYVVAPSGCWIWQGALSTAGYGRFGGKEYAHRFSYVLHKGPIPAGTEVDHLCRVRRCCNPMHLQAVPRRVNFLRGAHPTAQIVRSDVCGRGHSMADAYQRKSGKRTCRQCSQDNERRRRKEAQDEAAA
jgi:hypothetical protein